MCIFIALGNSVTNLAILWTGILPVGGFIPKHDLEIFCFFYYFTIEAHCFALLEIIIKFFKSNFYHFS